MPAPAPDMIAVLPFRENSFIMELVSGATLFSWVKLPWASMAPSDILVVEDVEDQGDRREFYGIRFRCFLACNR
jgi:hypothetical protein